MPHVPFIASQTPDRPALRDDLQTTWITYGDLARSAEQWARRMAGPRGLVFLYASNDCQSVAALLGALAAGHAVTLLDPNLAEKSQEALEAPYFPAWIYGPEPGALRATHTANALHPDLAILLSTSGSTGSAKLVRLTLPALQANAAGIAEVLHIEPDDVAAGYLPLHYSYGLSVLTSHLVRGARVRLTGKGAMDRDFWNALRDDAVTHMPGVPFHYRVMLKLGLRRLDLPHVRTLTQAGGALETDARRQLHEYMERKGGRFFVMYGQTEAAPRMTTLQHEDFAAAPSSVGTPLPGCRIELQDPDEQGRGEVVFHGPNVMMGYAETAADLGRSDECGGRLATGDLGVVDAAGRLTIVGRIKRMSKLHGLRINLDEIEGLVNQFGATAVTQSGESLVIHVATTGSAADDQTLTHTILENLRNRFTIPPTTYRVRIVPAIPRTERGKVDYPALEAHA